MPKTENEKEIALKIEKARSHKNLVWLGLLLFPLAIVFFVICKNDLRELRAVYDLDDKAALAIQKIKKEATIALVIVLGIWLIFLFCQMITIGSSTRNTVYYYS